MRYIVLYALSLFFIISCNTEEPEEFDITPPDEVSLLELSSNDSIVRLNWSDPGDDDLREIEVSWETDTVYVTKGIRILEITDLPIGNIFNFLLRTIDETGNKSEGVSIQGGIDYRYNYTGHFEFLSYNDLYNLYAHIFEIEPDSLIWEGAITRIGDMDSMIHIHYRPSNQYPGCTNGITVDLEIEPDGSLYAQANCYPFGIDGLFFGYDSLVFVVSNYISEGIGEWAQWVYGKRIE